PILDLKREHATEHRHLFCSNLMSRMRLQSGIMDAGHFSMLGKETGDFHRVFRMRAHPPRQGTHAAQDQPAIKRRGDCSALVLNAADTLKKIALKLRNDNSPEDIAMAAEVFCCGMQ